MENNATRQLQTLALPKNWGGKEEINIFLIPTVDQFTP